MHLLRCLPAVGRRFFFSKGEMGAEDVAMKFHQLQSQHKHLRFASSPIHDWGLYALKRIQCGEMVIEYVAEVIRASVVKRCHPSST